MHYLTAILAGGGAGAWTALLLPVMARHIGARGGFSPVAALLLIAGGAALSMLFSRLLRWADPENRPPRSLDILFPWLAALFLPASLLLPEGSRFFMTGSILGPVKHVLAAAWILGVGIFATRLLPPLLGERRPERVAAGFTAILLFLSFVLATQPPNESDEGDYVASALALIETGSTRVDRVVENGRMEAYYFGRLPATWVAYQAHLTREPERINRHSYRMIGYPLILAPFLKAAMLTDTPWLRWLISFLPGLIGYFLLLQAVASLSGGAASRAGRIALVAIGSMTPFLYFPTNTQPEIWMATGVAWALLLHRRHFEGKSSVVSLAAVTTLMVLLHERMAIPAAVLLVATFARTADRRRLLITSALGAIPVILSYAAVLQFRLPTGAPHAYGIEGIPFFDGARWLEAIRQHLVSSRIGLFTHLPALLIIPLGFRRSDLSLSHRDGASRRVALALFGVYFLVLITYPHTFDSFPHLRYMVPVLPALGFLLPPAVARLEAYPWGRPLTAFLVGLQIVRAWPFLAVPQLWRWYI